MNWNFGVLVACSLIISSVSFADVYTPAGGGACMGGYTKVRGNCVQNSIRTNGSSGGATERTWTKSECKESGGTVNVAGNACTFQNVSQPCSNCNSI